MCGSGAGLLTIPSVALNAIRTTTTSPYPLSITCTTLLKAVPGCQPAIWPKLIPDMPSEDISFNMLGLELPKMKMYFTS